MLKLRSGELSGLSEQERASRLREFVDAAKRPRDDRSDSLDAMIRQLESRYVMTSEQMLERFSNGELDDTADVARWLILVEARG